MDPSRALERHIDNQIMEALLGKTNDPISPSYYSRFAIQPIEFIVKNGLDFLQGNVIKYVCRFDQKNGIEDLKKARSNLDKMIEREQAKLDKIKAEREARAKSERLAMYREIENFQRLSEDARRPRYFPWLYEKEPTNMRLRPVYGEKCCGRCSRTMGGCICRALPPSRT